MRATFVPCARRIYARTFRVISGFGPQGVLAQMRAPRMRRLSAACSSGRHFAYSFLRAPPRGECLTLAVRLTVPITRARRGLPPPSHRLVTTPTNRCLRTSRHTWRTSGRRAPRGALLPHHRAYGPVHGGSRSAIEAAMLMASPPPVGYCNSPAVALDTTQALLARLPAAQVGSGAGRCPAFLRLRSPSKDRPPSGAPCLALHRAVFPTTTASADSCRPIPTPCGGGSTPVAGGRPTGLPG